MLPGVDDSLCIYQRVVGAGAAQVPSPWGAEGVTRCGWVIVDSSCRHGRGMPIAIWP